MQLAKPAQFRDPPSAKSFNILSKSNLLPRKTPQRLPLHLVGLVALSEAERAGKVAGEHLYLLDVGNQSLVDSLLVRCSAAADLLLLYCLSC